VAAAAADLSQSGLLSPEGARFVEGVRRAVRRLGAEEVPVRPETLARLARLDNAISWRLRNCRPDPDEIGAWAAGWADDRPRPQGYGPGTRVVDGDGPSASEARIALFRSRLAYPATWRSEAVDASEADVHLVDRRDADAACSYRLRITKDPDDLAAWAGLGLCRGVPAPTRWALMTCPELLHGLRAAVATRIGSSPDLDDLAAWMARDVTLGPIWVA
jgi:hypothetical protein